MRLITFVWFYLRFILDFYFIIFELKNSFATFAANDLSLII